MPTTVSKFVEKCNEVYEAKPKYQNGASDLSECDCIGMDKYSFRQNGVKFSSTGTNWSFRNQVDNIRELKSADQLQVGDVVFKAYAPGESGYNLPEKYQQGGSGYNGDLNDYYHIGTVKSVNPLQIIHMTSPTAKMDTTLKNKGWDYAAQWKKDYISDYSPEPQPVPPEPTPPTPEPEMAVVWSENGKPVNSRKGPDETYPLSLAGKIPVDSMVTVNETTVNSQGEDWSKCDYTDPKGVKWKGIWIKSCFLKPVDEPEPETTTYTVHIPYLTADQADALIRQYPGAWKTVEQAVG